MPRRQKRALPDLDAGYVRVSAVDLTNYGNDRERAYDSLISARLTELREAAARQEKTIPDELVFVDMDRSGRHLSNRPGMLELIELAKSGGVARIWFRNISRAFRSVEDQAVTRRIIESAGVRLISLQEPSEGEKAAVNLIWNIMSAVSEYHADHTGDLIKRQNRHVASLGRLPTGRAPLGYVYDTETKAMTPDPSRSADALRVFQLYAETQTFTGAAQLLNAEGIRAGQGALWRHSKVKKLLVNPVYRGRVHYDGEEWPGLHDLIIPEQLLRQVDAVLDATCAADPRGRRNPSRQYTYSRLLTCGLCGSTLRAQPTTPDLMYWVCSARHDRAACDMPSYRTEELDRFVLEGIQMALTACLDDLRAWISSTPDALEVNAPPPKRPSGSPSREIQAAMNRIAHAYAQGIMPLEQYTRLSREYEARLERVSREGEEERPSAHGTVADVLDFRRRLGEGWKELSQADRRQVIGEIVHGITIYPDQLVLDTRLPAGRITVPTDMFDVVSAPAGDISDPAEFPLESPTVRHAPGRT